MSIRSNTSKLLVILVAICAYGLAPAAQSASNASENAATEMPEHISQRISEIFEKLDELAAEMRQRSREYLTPMSDDELAKVYVKIHSRPFDVALQKVKENRQLVIANLVRHGYAWSKQDDEYFDHHYEQLVGELASLGPEALPELALYMSRPYIAEGKSPLTMRALAKMGTNVVEPLIKLADAQDYVLRKNVIHVLSWLADPRAKDVFLRSLDDDYGSVREYALRGLAKLGPDIVGRQKLITLLIAHLQDKACFRAAMWGLNQYGDESAIEPLSVIERSYRTKGEEGVRRVASEVIENIRRRQASLSHTLLTDNNNLPDAWTGKLRSNTTTIRVLSDHANDEVTTEVMNLLSKLEKLEEKHLKIIQRKNKGRVIYDMNSDVPLYINEPNAYPNLRRSTFGLNVAPESGLEQQLFVLRRETADQIAALGEPAVPILIKRLGSLPRKFLYCRRCIRTSLSRIGASAIPYIIRAVQDARQSDKSFSYVYIQTLHSAFENISDPDALELLLVLFSRNEPDYVRYRGLIASVLGNIRDKRAVQPVISELEKRIAKSKKLGNLQYMTSFVEALRLIGDKRAVAPIIDALDIALKSAQQTGDWDNHGASLMRECTQALGAWGDKRAIAVLKRALKAGPQRTRTKGPPPQPQYLVAEEAAKALRSLGLEVTGDKEKGGYQVIEVAPLSEVEKALEEPVKQEGMAEGIGKQQQSLVVFPEDATTMNLRWVPGKPDDVSAVQKIELLLIRRYYTYEVDTRDLISGQVANKSLGWAVYPSLEGENQQPFPVKLIVRTKQPATPHPNYRALVKKVRYGRRLQWTANERRVPAHFGYFGLETEEKVPEVEIRRECVLLGDGRALIKTTVRAQMPLLIRIWGLKRRVSVEPESIEPQNYRLSDNGVLFFNYGKDPEELGSESEYKFVISGLGEEEIFYPMTNALHHVQMCSRGCPDNPIRQVRGSVWGFTFTLKSERYFRIARLERWVNELYQLKAITVKPSKPVTGKRQRAGDTVVPQVRDYDAARNVPQPIELWKAKEYGCGGNPRTQQKLRTDVKRQYPILLTWPLIQEASKYVVQIKGVRGSRPAIGFESITNRLRLEEADIVPGRYQWSVSVYDKHRKFMGDVETINPVEIFAIEDPEPVAVNGKKALIDLNHSAGHIRGWGYYNHAQYMTKELLENSGFDVEVNGRDLLTADRLKSVDLLICHYYWTGWPGFRPYLKSELSTVRQFVENGGSLLVIGCDREDGGGKMSKVGNELVKEFGLMFELDKISKQNGFAKPAPDQNIISFDKPVQVQLSVGVQSEDAITLLQFDGLPIVKAKQFGRGKVVIAGVGMSFLDCYLGDFEHREPLHLVMFSDLIKYLTDIDWKKNCKRDFIEMVLSRCQFQEK